jgi:hypothetical protein
LETCATGAKRAVRLPLDCGGTGTGAGCKRRGVQGVRDREADWAHRDAPLQFVGGQPFECHP